MKYFYVYGVHPIAPSHMVKDGKKYKILASENGSIVSLIDNDGNSIQTREYDAFGMVVSDTNPGFQVLGFNSGMYDMDTQLVRFGARDYDPTVSRWTTKDPIGFAGGDTNLYAYVGGNPMTYVDPSGHSAIAVAACIGYFAGTGYLDVKSYFNINDALKTARGAANKSRIALQDEVGKSCPDSSRVSKLEEILNQSTQDALRLEQDAAKALKVLGGYPESLGECLSMAVLIPSI